MGDVYMVNGKILSGLPNHAKDIEFDNDGTTLNSTNTEDAIKEVNSNLSAHTLGSAIALTFGVNYTAPSDGYVRIVTTGNYIQFSINGSNMVNLYNNSTYSSSDTMSLFVRKGMILTPYGDGGTCTFYPLE